MFISRDRSTVAAAVATVSAAVIVVVTVVVPLSIRVDLIGWSCVAFRSSRSY